MVTLLDTHPVVLSRPYFNQVNTGVGNTGRKVFPFKVN